MIDRKKVIKGVKNAIQIEKRNGKALIYLRISDAKDILALLEEQEAKTGKWERQYSRPGVYANLFWWCSVCGEPTIYNDAGIFYKYCPRCGAKLEPCIET